MMYKKRWGDRSDGRRLKSLDPITTMGIHVIRNRIEAQNFFETDFSVQRIQQFIRQRKETGTQYTFLDILVAALVRMLSQKPALNRFVHGNHVYVRNKAEIAFIAKKEIAPNAPLTQIKLSFNLDDTLPHISKEIAQSILQVRQGSKDSSTDKTLQTLFSLPAVFKVFTVKMLIFLDNRRMLPKKLIAASPFHTGIFISDLGSIGAPAIFHHLYKNGTTSIFIAFGAKKKHLALDDSDKICEDKKIDIRAVVDGRICDGFTYVSGLKQLLYYLNNPEELERPPEKVFQDID